MYAYLVRAVFSLSLILSTCLINPSSVYAEPPAPLTFAIHPYLPANELHTRFQPLADFIGKTLGRNVEIRVGRDYAEHVRAVGTDEVDIAFMGPSLYVLTTQEYGPKPLLARIAVNGKPELYGAIIVRKDSTVHTLAELKGHSFAFGDPESTMSHIVPEGMLHDAGVPLSALREYKFLGAHRNVALGVLSGDFDAGAVKKEVYEEYADRGLRILTETPPVSEHLLVTRADMPADQVDKLRQALLQLKDRPEAKQIMESIHKGMTAFVPVTDADYDSLRGLMHNLKAAE